MAHPLAPYPSPERREALLDELGSKAEIVVYGESREGRPLRAVRIPSFAPGLPRVLCTANIHGPELIGCWMALELLQRLAVGSLEERAVLRERAEVWIAPCLNPDGYARTWEAEGRGRLVDLRTNAAAVDLNRNFPPPAGKSTSNFPWAGSSRRGSANYRGPEPLSEPETAALDAHLGGQGFHASINLHSFMGTVIPARVTDRSHFATYKRLAGCFRAAQGQFRYRRLSARRLDVYTGELEDHQHHNRGCWAMCAEIMTVGFSYRQHMWAPSLFWRFNPRDPDPWATNDIPAIRAYLLAALDVPRPFPR